MRIAIVSDGVHPYVMGGMQRHTFYLCKYLSQQGIFITLVHYNNSKLDISKLEIFTDFEKRYIEHIVLDFPDSDKLPGHYIRASYLYSCRIYNMLKNRLNDFDFIYTKGFSGWKLIEEKEKSKIKFPPIGVKFHGYEMFQKQADLKSFIQSRMLRKSVKWITLHADYVFSYGSKITDIIQTLNVPKSKIIEIPAGIEKEWISDEIKPSSDTLVFTYLGRYERRKGIEELNIVLKQLIKENTSFIFNFIGPFETHQQINSNRIIYHGTLTDNNRIKQILDQTDFLVCPSWSEGMPNVILEAMARACAIISTDVGAVSTMVNEENGYLIEPGNPKALKLAITNALKNDYKIISDMKVCSQDKIRKQFDYQHIIEKLKNKLISITNS